MQPAALTKAESLIRHAHHLGVKPEEFQVALTLGEAYELLDFLVAQHNVAQQSRLEADVAEAKTSCNPWAVLVDFNLCGLEIVRQVDLH